MRHEPVHAEGGCGGYTGEQGGGMRTLVRRTCARGKDRKAGRRRDPHPPGGSSGHHPGGLVAPANNGHGDTFLLRRHHPADGPHQPSAPGLRCRRCPCLHIRSFGDGDEYVHFQENEVRWCASGRCFRNRRNRIPDRSLLLLTRSAPRGDFQEGVHTRMRLRAEPSQSVVSIIPSTTAANSVQSVLERCSFSTKCAAIIVTTG